MRTRTEGGNTVQRDTLGRFFRLYQGKPLSESNFLSPPYYKYYKVCKDEIHPKYPHQGGPLSISMVGTTFADKGIGRVAGVYYYHPLLKYWMTGTSDAYDGSFRCLPPSLPGIPDDNSDYTESLGADAWNRFKPGKPAVGLGQAIAEMRDIRQLAIRRLRDYKAFVQRARELVRKGSGNYLSVAFGWKPMISDMLAWISSIQDMDKQIAQLRNLNGKWNRRGGTLFDTVDTTVTSGTTNRVVPGSYVTAPSWTNTVTTHKRAWFKGVFRYYIPGLDDPRWGKLNCSRELWDLNVTPELVWQLTPWSWLANWFTNIGSVVSNLQSQVSDQVAAKYAYVMCQTTTDAYCEARGSIGYQDTYNTPRKYIPIVVSSTNTRETKCRAEASPFGFGFDWSGLTAFQSSILAALKLSRLKPR